MRQESADEVVSNLLATWAKRLSWQEVATIFGTSWDSVHRAIHWVVSWGIVHREVSGLESIGIDEIQYRRGHKYLTLVYQLDEGIKRVLYVAKDRTEASLHGFFDILDASTISGIKFACTDMLPAYLNIPSCSPFRTSQILNTSGVISSYWLAIMRLWIRKAKNDPVSRMPLCVQ